jgi:hypothetical protein
MGFSRNSAPADNRPARRLNWGCGEHVAKGWINSDVKDDGAVDLVADIRNGLPLSDACIDYAVSVHALPELTISESERALTELLRVLRPGGVLRLALPDLRLAIEAFQEGRGDYFKVEPEAAASIDGRFIRHILWYGYSRTLFTPVFAAELMEGAGFIDVHDSLYGSTESEFSGITELDNRPDESFFLEGTRAAGDKAAGGCAYNAGVVQPPPITVSEIIHLTPNEDLRGHFRIEHSDSTLKLVGWALGPNSPVHQISVLSGSQVVGRSPAVLERPDIGQMFPGMEGANTCGFELALEPVGDGRSKLLIQVELQNGSAVPLGELQVNTARRRRKGLFGFGR